MQTKEFDVRKSGVLVLGQQYDHKILKVKFTGLNYDRETYLKVVTDKAAEPEVIRLENHELVVGQPLTQKYGKFKAQLFCTNEAEEEVQNSRVFEVQIYESLGDGEVIDYPIPPEFQSKYDEMVKIIEEVQQMIDSGDFEGDSAYEVAVQNGFEGTEQKWLDSLRYDHSEEFTSLVQNVAKYASDALNAAQSASQSAESARQAATSAGESVQSAINAASSASEAAQSATEGAQSAKESAQSALEGAQSASESAQSALKAKDHADTAKTEADRAKNEADRANRTVTEALETIQAEGTKQVGNVTAEGKKQIKAVQDKGTEVLQSIPEDYRSAMASKLDKNQGAEHAGKALVIGEDGNVVPGEVQTSGGDGIAIVNTMSGESPLVIPDSAERQIKDLKLSGKSEQTQTTGKNLLEEKISAFTIADDIAYIPLPEGHEEKQYTMLIQKKSGKNDSVGFSCGFYDKTNMTEIYKAPCLEGGKLVSSNGIVVSKKGVNHYVCFTPASEEFFSIYNVIYTEGNLTSMTYEPYTGGQPSPSPEYPQEIKNTGKYNEDTGKYEVAVKVCGNNLLKEQFSEFKIRDNIAYIPLPEGHDNHDYTMLIQKKSGKIDTIGFTCGFYDHENMSEPYKAPCLVKGVLVSQNGIVVDKRGVNHWVCFTPADEKFFDIYNVMYVEGKFESLQYQPYREPQTLTLTSDRPVTKWDKLVEQDGQIGWLYATKNTQLSNHDTWVQSDNEELGLCFCINVQNASIGLKTSFIESLKNIDGVTSSKYKDSHGCYGDNNGTNYKNFRPPVESIKSIEEFKAWLAENKTIILYKSIETEFVPLQQSEQDAIRALKTYYPTTVITVDGGEVDPDVEVTYVADMKNYVDNKFAELNKALVNTQAQLL